MRFYSIHRALGFYYDTFSRYPKSIDLESVRVDGGGQKETDWIQKYATIGFYIRLLDYEQEFILQLYYAREGTSEQGLSDQEIAHKLNRELGYKKWHSKSLRKERQEIIRKLDGKFREIGLIENRDII